MTTSELTAMKELLNNGIHLDVKDYVFNGTVNIFGVNVKANIKWSGTIDVDGLGDVVEEVIVSTAQADLDVLVKSCIKSPMNGGKPNNFYSNHFNKKD